MPLAMPSVTLIVLVLAAARADIHVSPRGDDAADGTAASPLRSVDAALSRLRGVAGPAQIILRDGVHAPVRVTPEDTAGRDESSRLTICGAPGESAVISGGVSVPPRLFSPHPWMEGVVVADLSQVAGLPSADAWGEIEANEAIHGVRPGERESSLRAPLMETARPARARSRSAPTTGRK